SRNIFIKNKKVYVIDFQDAGFFPRLYDLASLLYDVYVCTRPPRSSGPPRSRNEQTPSSVSSHKELTDTTIFKQDQYKMTDKEREKLLLYFVSCHPDLKSVGEIRRELAITTVQRLFKACGSFAGFFSLKKQSTHLKYVVPTLNMLRTELQNIKEYPGFLTLVDLLLDQTDRESE
ncbi:MAG: phosphotransferase, partial [Oligoflexia bacterium]|nr:phosphotransferase [Oligoflexia bacterium]